MLKITLNIFALHSTNFYKKFYKILQVNFNNLANKCDNPARCHFFYIDSECVYMLVLVKNDTLDPGAGGLITNVMYYYIKGYNFLTN